MLLIAGRPSEARGLRQRAARVGRRPRRRCCCFPRPTRCPTTACPNDPDKLAERLGTLERLAGLSPAAATPPLVVASVRAAMDLVLDPQTFRDNHRVGPPRPGAAAGRAGRRVARAGLRAVADRRSARVCSAAAAASWTSSRPAAQPLRIELWGDEVDTIRLFDPATQRSTEQLEKCSIGPAHEVLPRPLPLSLELDSVRPQFVDPFHRDLRMLHEGSQAFGALEFYRGFLGAATLVDYLPADGILAIDEPEAVTATAARVRGTGRAIARRPARARRSAAWPGATVPPVARTPCARSPAPTRLEVRLDPDRDGLPFVHAPKYGGRLDPFLADLVERKRRHRPSSSASKPVACASCCRSRACRRHARDSLPAQPSAVELVNGLLREGWVSDELGLALFTDSEIFGWTKQRRSAPTRRLAFERRRRRASRSSPTWRWATWSCTSTTASRATAGWCAPRSAPCPARTTTLELPGHAEFLLLHYAEGDNLYVPISQADRVGRYIGAGDADPSLTRLGSGEWVRAKAKVRRSVRDLAQELMELYGARAALEGHAYPADTPVAARARRQLPVRGDARPGAGHRRGQDATWQSPRPMDRLLVGDVGFGKTEVALRAAFKAVQDGRQVAVLVPTTVLAQQHFNTFRERLGRVPGQGRDALALPLGQGAARDHGRAGRRQRRHLHRHPSPGPERRRVQEPGAGRHRRGAALRRRATRSG